MTTAGAAISLAREFAAIVGEEHVAESAGELAERGIDGVAPSLAVAAGSPEEVAAIMRLAHEHELRVTPIGGGTQIAIGNPPHAIDLLLDLRRLDKIEYYDPGDLTISLQAGITVAELQRRIGEHRQMLPLDPAAAARATIGGTLASVSQGPMRHAHGGVRDFCIGIQFVTADGKLAKGGGRVVKNVAGYDMMKLLIGSFGTLGIIVGANFKVFPRPAQTREFIAEFGSPEEAIAFRDRVLASPLTPMCLDIVSPRAAEYLPHVGASVPWRVLVRAGGSDAVLARYRAELGSAIVREVQGADEEDDWRRLADFDETVLARHHNAMVVRVGLPISAVAPALAAAERAATDHNFLCAAVGRAGIGSLIVAFIPIAVDPPSAMQYANAVSQLRGALPEGAFAIVTRCPLEAKPRFDVWGVPTADLAVMRAVKQALDPKDILNRGRFLV
jgi:glycolate oxidase FAD binding subunit